MAPTAPTVAPAPRPPLGLSLFWRTFVLLALLLAGGVIADRLRALEFEPRAVQAAQQTARLVNLARAALKTADGINRVMLLEPDGAKATRVTPREPSDSWETFEVDRFTRRVSQELRGALGRDAVVARSVNGQPGLWVGFSIDRDRYWLQTESAQTGPWAAAPGSSIGVALPTTLVGSVAIARLINRPLKQLSFAASRIRDGDLDSRLDENTLTSEIREVNRGFNRMARELARVEEDRAVMLAGISHDLRTPLARLRLETEMSVDDEEAKRNMAMDIDELDAIIDKFMDYARPGETRLRPVRGAADRARGRCAGDSARSTSPPASPDLVAMADEIELGRVFLNLFENARRYGRGTDTGVAEVTSRTRRRGPGSSSACATTARAWRPKSWRN